MLECRGPVTGAALAVSYCPDSASSVTGKAQNISTSVRYAAARPALGVSRNRTEGALQGRC